MRRDPLYQYILLHTPRRTRTVITSQFMPGVFVPDPYNRHYDDRRTWLAWRDPDPPRIPMRQRLGRTLVRIGRWLAGEQADPMPSLNTTSV